MNNDTKEALAIAKGELTKALQNYAIVKDSYQLNFIELFSGAVSALVQLAQLEEKEVPTPCLPNTKCGKPHSPWDACNECDLVP